MSEKIKQTNSLWKGIRIVIAALLLFVFSLVVFVRSVHDFLSPTNKIDTAEILVVEGLTPDFALPAAIEEFNSGGYKMMICSGIPILKGSFLVDFGSAAQVTANSLVKLGFPKDSLVVVATNDIKRDRTYACGLALADYLKKHCPEKKKVNLFSLAAHSRRSHFLFEQALGDDFEVGIIAAEDLRYDASKWWTSSNGFRSVITETIGWIYARFFFHPEI